MEQQPEHDSSWNTMTSGEQTRSILAILIVIAVIMAGLSWVAKSDLTLADFGVNLSTELFGAAITFYFLSVILEHTKKKEEKVETEKELKARLIREMGSTFPEVAITATGEMASHGWLQDGSLNKAKLDRANLQGAILDKANLQFATFYRANFQYASLIKSNLKTCLFWVANLHGAHLMGGDFTGSSFAFANLYGADLFFAKMSNTNFKNATLEKAILENTVLYSSDLEGTNWTPETDMSRFTDPDHPEFWRSDNPDSPAYRGKT